MNGQPSPPTSFFFTETEPCLQKHFTVRWEFGICQLSDGALGKSTGCNNQVVCGTDVWLAVGWRHWELIWKPPSHVREGSSFPSSCLVEDVTAIATKAEVEGPFANEQPPAHPSTWVFWGSAPLPSLIMLGATTPSAQLVNVFRICFHGWCALAKP